jgi:hypothetical protein
MVLVMDDPPEYPFDVRFRTRRCDGSRSRSAPTQSGVSGYSIETYGRGECGAVQPEWTVAGFGG